MSTKSPLSFIIYARETKDWEMPTRAKWAARAHRQTFAEITASAQNSHVHGRMRLCRIRTRFSRDSFRRPTWWIHCRITLAVNKAPARMARKGNIVNKGDLISTCDSAGYECLSKIISLRSLSIVLIEAPPAIRPDKFRCNIAGG